MNPDSVSTITEYINNHPLAVISTIDPDGKPYGTTLYAASDDQLNVYFITKTETHKSRYINLNPNVALTFTGEDHQTTLQLSGQAIELSTAEEGSTAFHALDSIRHHHQDFRLPISKLQAGPYIVYKVIVSHALLTQYESPGHAEGVNKIEYAR